jgi:ABC-2 type transport system permease protein
VRTLLLIAAKDLRQRLRDRSVLLFAVAAPLGLAVIFSQLLAGATEFHARYAVADLDSGSLATSFRQEVLGGLVSSGVAEVVEVADAAAARTAVDGDTADAAFVIPAGFGAAIQAGEATRIDIIGAADTSLATEIARSVAARFGDGVVTLQLSLATAASLRGGSLSAEQIGQVVAAVSSADPPVALADSGASLRQLSWSTFFSASMAIMFLFFAAQVGMVSLFEERRQGTLARMLAGPISAWSIVAGKALGSFVTAVVAMAILVVATSQLIGASWGPPAGVALLVLGAVTAAIGIAALVTSFMTSADGASAAGSAVAITLAILGGSFTPTSQAPEAMAQLALLTPHGWFLRGLGDMQGGGGPAEALPAIAILLAIGLITGTLGLARARRLVVIP